MDRLLLERISLPGICWAVKVFLRWLMSHITKLYDQVAEDLHFEVIIKAKQKQKSCYIELIKSDRRPGQSDEIKTADAVKLCRRA